ncbi:hypothetical protein CURE108131_20855 [Cupriavidus respiraculi]|uniref:Uncharacterized protein n=1 Tax=Cupriavidus respiraculi TaxID=195930 RepID=A0ABM8X017_9BURK|nr:hypothetical protein [Cupriavidus respiraculi]CAG9173201.1 hypothetical protein LMG21510_02183 [Cupriavidus respiraculi]
MSRRTLVRECSDGPAICPDYELVVDFEDEGGHIDILSVAVVFPGSNTEARLGPRNYDRAAVLALCLDQLERQS